MSKKVIERVALASFSLGGTSVLQGQIVELDDNQFERAVAALCVYKDENADITARKSFSSGVSGAAVIAATNETPQAVRITEAQTAADAQINRIDEMVNHKRDEASVKIAEIDEQVIDARTIADSDLVAINSEVSDARKQADIDIEAIRKEVEAARTDAGTERLAIAKEISDARDQANKDLAAIADEVEKAKKSGKDK